MTQETPRVAALRAEVLDAVRRYGDAKFESNGAPDGPEPVPIAGRLIETPELLALVDASLDGWLTEGRHAERFRADFARVAGREDAVLTGSGSQANTLAVAAACSDLVEEPLRAGEEVITPALAFPTTINPIY